MKEKIVVGIFAMFFLGTTQAYAATLYMDPGATQLSRGDTLKVSIRLDTDENECVNVVDGVITYSENIEAVDVSRGSSIMSMWVEEPTIDSVNNTITFAGGIPNGYCGRIAGDPRLTNVVVDLLFQAPGFVIGASDNATATIAFTDQSNVRLNDGFGTVADTLLLGSSVVLQKNNGKVFDNQWKDVITSDVIFPEEFSISLERSENAFGNKYFISFNTTDKQSGMDHYEVIEESFEESRLFNWGREDAPWLTTTSPYKLKDQTLNSTIRVRAVDKAGNEYIAVLIPEEVQRTIPAEVKVLFTIVAAVAGGVVTGGMVFFILRRRKVNKHDEDQGDKDEIV